MISPRHADAAHHPPTTMSYHQVVAPAVGVGRAVQLPGTTSTWTETTGAATTKTVTPANALHGPGPLPT